MSRPGECRRKPRTSTFHLLPLLVRPHSTMHNITKLMKLSSYAARKALDSPLDRSFSIAFPLITSCRYRVSAKLYSNTNFEPTEMACEVSAQIRPVHEQIRSHVPLTLPITDCGLRVGREYIRVGSSSASPIPLLTVPLSFGPHASRVPLAP